MNELTKTDMKKFTDKINESVENGIPTAYSFALEFFNRVVGENSDEINGYIKECMIEFAKLHVEAALKEASVKAEIYYDYEGNTGSEYNTEYVSKESILKSYPLDNIK